MVVDNERQFIEVENLNGEIEQVEIFAEIKSQRDDKVYVLITSDETIEEEVNMTVGYIYEEDGKMNLELVESAEELNYVYSLINKSLMEVQYEGRKIKKFKRID